MGLYERAIITVVQTILIICLLAVIVYLAYQSVAISKARRVSKYSLESTKNNKSSSMEKFKTIIEKIIINSRKRVSKVSFLKMQAKRYEQFINYENKHLLKGIDIITAKLLLASIFLLITIFAQTLRSSIVTIFELAINFLIGYYLLDIYLIYQKKVRNKRIENNILRAIIIMNNAFKSGKSTLQAVELVSNELPEPINGEFKRIYKDLQYGLATDVVFKRFAERVDIEEARYLASSLTILNRTGGNIINVFNSIERTLFSKKKLQEELKNLTVSSNMLVKFLLIVPIIFVLIIYLLNPGYFDPLFNSPLGYMIIGIIIIMFAIYAWFMQRIMKVNI